MLLWVVTLSYATLPFVVMCSVVSGVVPLLLQFGEDHSQKDIDAPTPELAKNHGYLCETHEVETADGYVLCVHRLLGGRVSKPSTQLLPVLLQHGILDSSADWMIGAGPGTDTALGCILADQGYDVWMGNARGNFYSRRHKNLIPEDSKFWNWSWHEMGYYDLPAVIDHILAVTGHSQIFYVGHSMGTTMFFVLCATRPEYNAKVRFMAALAPVAFLGHTNSPLRLLTTVPHGFEILYNNFRVGELLSRNLISDLALKSACAVLELQETICSNLLFFMVGQDPNQFDEALLKIILGHLPAGTSTKTVAHYTQGIKSHKFRQYDYGADNIHHYNSTTPPDYDLSQVTVPVALHCGDNDLLAHMTDVQSLFEGLANPVGKFIVNLEGWNHLDFLWGSDAKALVYAKVQQLLRQYSNVSVPLRS